MLGPFGSSAGLNHHLMVRLKAARMALEGKRLRMVIARQAKYMKQGNTYRDIPPEHKLHLEWQNTYADESATYEVMLYLQEKAHSVDELAKRLNVSSDKVMDCFKKLEKKQLVASDRLLAP